MPHITIAVKTPFGEIRISGKTPHEVIETLESLDQLFVSRVNDRVSDLLMSQAKDNLKGIVEIGRDGPIIVTKKKLSHYEAIGLILYGLKDHQASSRQVRKRLTASGKKVTVPARIHEMRKRGHIFKPVDKAPYYKLSIKGIKWIEDEVLPPLQKGVS
jgi:hypothetical protein